MNLQEPNHYDAGSLVNADFVAAQADNQSRVSHQSQISVAIASGGLSDNMNRTSLSAYRESSSSTQQLNHHAPGYQQEGYGGNPNQAANQGFSASLPAGSGQTQYSMRAAGGHNPSNFMELATPLYQPVGGQNQEHYGLIENASHYGDESGYPHNQLCSPAYLPPMSSAMGPSGLLNNGQNSQYMMITGGQGSNNIHSNPASSTQTGGSNSNISAQGHKFGSSAEMPPPAGLPLLKNSFKGGLHQLSTARPAQSSPFKGSSSQNEQQINPYENYLVSDESLSRNYRVQQSKVSVRSRVDTVERLPILPHIKETPMSQCIQFPFDTEYGGRTVQELDEQRHYQPTTQAQRQDPQQPFYHDSDIPNPEVNLSSAQSKVRVSNRTNLDLIMQHGLQHEEMLREKQQFPEPRILREEQFYGTKSESMPHSGFGKKDQELLPPSSGFGKIGTADLGQNLIKRQCEQDYPSSLVDKRNSRVQHEGNDTQVYAMEQYQSAAREHQSLVQQQRYRREQSFTDSNDCFIGGNGGQISVQGMPVQVLPAAVEGQYNKDGYSQRNESNYANPRYQHERESDFSSRGGYQQNNQLSPSDYMQNTTLHHSNRNHGQQSNVDAQFRPIIKVKSEDEPYVPQDATSSIQRHVSNELTFSRNQSYGGPQRSHHEQSHQHITLQPNRRRESSPQHDLRSSSSSQYNFCNSCHLEHLRRLNDEEQRKLQEIEQIKREKETLIKSASIHTHAHHGQPTVPNSRSMNHSQLPQFVPNFPQAAPQAASQQKRQYHQSGLDTSIKQEPLVKKEGFPVVPPSATSIEQSNLFSTLKIENPSEFRKIGKLTLQERYAKIKRFKEKKQRRNWDKKIFYDCRKKVADKRLRIKGRFIRKEDQKKLLQQVFGNGELFPQDVKEFNSTLTQLMSEYQRQRLREHQIDTHDFIIEQQDAQGVKHRFFDFKKFNNFIEGEDYPHQQMLYAPPPPLPHQPYEEHKHPSGAPEVPRKPRIHPAFVVQEKRLRELKAEKKRAAKQAKMSGGGAAFYRQQRKNTSIMEDISERQSQPSIVRHEKVHVLL
ncbi:hypothetical protein FGO68_gene12946 [Halteria grandinella]|uniref:CCT domain-containing protein n=1 Tax=Halteria grandinella TaxID=5974 RepID=A0A8J8P176_HALGN|nr:hypothetical protein FGO68_gene12946 [Halteria grandinella]